MKSSMLRISRAHSFAGGALAFALVACGSSAPTKELADARRAYEDAEDGPAKTQRPGELRAAKRALDRAEAAHEDDPGSAREKRLAEAAEHRAKVADARGEAAQAELAAQAARNRASQEQQAMRPSEERASAAKVEPVRPKDEVMVNDSAARADRDEDRELAPGAAKVDDDLRGLMHGSTVREEERGTVITMSGGLLFPSGKADLNDAAEAHLDAVADALKKQPENTMFRVEGYTDSSGSAAQNKQLATQRARAVAEYLSDHGIDEDRLKSVGYGEQRPVADNDNDEGRAANRRIEIVITKNAAADKDKD